jgi:hypothetical protein
MTRLTGEHYKIYGNKGQRTGEVTREWRKYITKTARVFYLTGSINMTKSRIFRRAGHAGSVHVQESGNTNFLERSKLKHKDNIKMNHREMNCD